MEPFRWFVWDTGFFPSYLQVAPPLILCFVVYYLFQEYAHRCHEQILSHVITSQKKKSESYCILPTITCLYQPQLSLL